MRIIEVSFHTANCFISSSIKIKRTRRPQDELYWTLTRTVWAILFIYVGS